LTVKLFPFLPTVSPSNFGFLLERITREFEAENPEVGLTVIIEQNCYEHDAYHMDPEKSMVPTDANVFEIDLIRLEEFAPYLAELTAIDEHVFPAADTAAHLGTKRYAIPTWVCTEFLFGRDPHLKEITSVDDLRGLLDKGVNGHRKLTGDFAGHFTLSALYAHAFVETSDNGPRTVGDAMTTELEPNTVTNLARLVAECTDEKKDNPCIDGKFHSQDADGPLREFQGGALALAGYSETLFDVLVRENKTQDRDIVEIDLPLGPHPTPVIWVDGLVINRSNCPTQCQQDAIAFARYMNRPSTRHWICFSGDLPKGAPPRYLLPARQDFYDLPDVKNDPHYQAFLATVARAVPFPSAGYESFYQHVHKDLEKKVRGQETK